MHPYFSSEVNSSDIPSDNPIFQRTKKAYELVAQNELGRVLEIGCGEGYGIPILLQKATSYVGVDKNGFLISSLQNQNLPNTKFHKQYVPPLTEIETESVDSVVCFQVIEHVAEDELMLSEIKRVLKPGGKLYLTTPNAVKSVSRNPWHVREYTSTSLNELLKVLGSVDLVGIISDDKASEYYALSNTSTKKIVNFDVFNFSKWLPSALLYFPYEILNRFHRNQLWKKHPQLVESISSENYLLTTESKNSLDLFATVIKE